MNQKIGMAGSVITGISVLCFALCMLMGFHFGSYLVCMFLAIGYIMMTAGFQSECREEHRASGNLGAIFAGIYGGLIFLVYFAQTTAVRLDSLSDTAMQLLDYQQFGLFFDYDLLGYAMMALSTFFTGLTISPTNRKEKALKWLMIIHGIFFLSCFTVPMLGLFSAPQTDGADWTGVLLLEIWCAYFLPIAALSYSHFQNKS